MKVKQAENTRCPNQVFLISKHDKVKKDSPLFAVYQRFQAEDELHYLETKSLDGQQFYVRAEQDAEKLREAGAKIRATLDSKAQFLAVVSKNESVYPLIEGFLLASYQFLHYFKDRDKKSFALEALLVDEDLEAERVLELHHINDMVTWARDMVNEPVSFLNAEQFAAEIEKLGKTAGFKTTVLEKTQIESLKMGGLLAVNQGSIDPPTFSILEYKPKKAINKKPYVFVGKGVVYDTGGLSLKPTPNSMDVMKSDMAGAACVVGALALIALQELPVHVVVLVPATDNRPGLNAYAPGDVVTMYDGTTVEVLNTDAEGRMILADALAYAEKFKPELVIDAATLTGAAMRAIGEHAAIAMGNAEDSAFKRLEEAGNATHERVVRFPFWPEYLDEMKSSIADLKNIGGPNAGMITAGKFLEHFVKSPYIHMDIAGPAWLDRNSAYRPKGGTAYGVRLLYQFIKSIANEQKR